MRGCHVQLQLDPAHSLEGLLRHHPLCGEQVADHPQREQHDGRDEQHRAEDQRLHVTLAAAVGVGDDEANPDRERDHTDQRGKAPEHAQRLVLGVDSEDRDGVAPHIGAHRGEQARLARLRVGADRDVIDRDELLARLDDRLQRVGELRDDEQLDRRLAVVGAKAGGGVRHRCRGGLAHDPRAETLERLLQRREMLDARDLAVTDDHVGAPGEDRHHEPRDVGAVVLIVGIGVHDHVGARASNRRPDPPGSPPPGPCCSSGARCGRRRARARPRSSRRSSRRRSRVARRYRSPRPQWAGPRGSPGVDLPR